MEFYCLSHSGTNQTDTCSSSKVVLSRAFRRYTGVTSDLCHTQPSYLFHNKRRGEWRGDSSFLMTAALYHVQNIPQSCINQNSPAKHLSASLTFEKPHLKTSLTHIPLLGLIYTHFLQPCKFF